MSRNMGNKKQEKPKRSINRAYMMRRKLKKTAPKLIVLAFVIIMGGLVWAIASQNQVALADKPDTLAHEPATLAQTTTQESGQVVIQRSTYQLAGQDVAVRISGDPTPENNGLFYLYTDHLGSVVSVTDEDGNPVGDITRFYPYGTPRTGGASDITDQGFTGHKHNDDLGLIYMNSRYYVPGIGRFASADSIVPDPTDPQSFNRYAYVRNNPLKYTDPDGHCFFLAGIDAALCYGALTALTVAAVAAPNQDVVASAAQGLTDIVYAIGDNLEDVGNQRNEFLKAMAGNTASSPGDFDPNDDDDQNSVVETDFKVRGRNGNEITDIDSIERTANGEVWFVEEKSATWAQNPAEWAQKHVFEKGGNYVRAIQSGENLNISTNNIAFRFTGGYMDGTLQTEVEKAFVDLQKIYPEYNFQLILP